MEKAKETSCLSIQVHQESGMTNETGYPPSSRTGQDTMMANKVYDDQSSIHSGCENPLANKIDQDGRVNTMGDEKDDQLSIVDSLRAKLDDLSPESSDGRPSIFTVPKHLRKVNEKAYEPQILAIGPYHADKKHLKAMEKKKVYYLQMLLQEKREISLSNYVSAMKELEKDARACYFELESFYSKATDNTKTEGFVEMILLDACFIVQLLRRWYETRGNKTPQLSRRYEISQIIDFNDPLLKGGWIMSAMRRDLLLVENQLPFFVLQKFLDMTMGPNQQNYFCDLIFHFFDDMIPKRELEIELSIHTAKHLLDFMHKSWSPFSLKIGKSKKFGQSKNAKDFAAGSRKVWDIERGSPNVSDNLFKEDSWGFIRCATELKEAGIKFKNKKVEKDNLPDFKKVKNNLFKNEKVKKDNLFDIKFENGILEIPKLKIDDNSESFFRNLIAYEQFLQNPESSYVIDYLKFMNCLMNTSKDVELLCQSEVVQNGLGDDQVLANMINRLSDNVPFFPDFFLYGDIFSKVNGHCKQKWNKWIANLRHNYFNNPWALISFLAALFLLILTVAQTVFSVLPYI